MVCVVINGALFLRLGSTREEEEGYIAGPEIWHFETSSFHLPVGEMSITLDSVSTLLHLPVMEQLCDLKELEFEETRTTLVDLLGVDGGVAGAKMEDARGPKVRLNWFREIYAQRCQSQHWDYATRAYLLHLGVVALAQLYEQLGDASLASMKQMAGYLTLFQSWIYEHFPSIRNRWLVSLYDDTTPHATRWQSPRQSSTLAEICSQLDDLKYNGVVWHPYEAHRGIHPFFGICMYFGWIQIGDTISRHFLERVMRQFGFYQEIPRPTTTVADTDVVAVDYAWFHFMDHVIMNARFRRMARMLQSLISCHHVTEDTVAHQVSVDLLQIANEGINEYSPIRRA
ncbi:protein MAIN-LIKE 1-like [Vigna angularis]|uniref:protein MAIN-LIKE 1-like n=1 Tax=Phaseolus angularis TaxID=3914 RepID=UPI0022B44C70|nr:protein MAIN-LIKE 1-like [Vigna angularis]